jgi:hypothetical protein
MIHTKSISESHHHNNQVNLDIELSAPICNLDVEEWLESLTETNNETSSNDVLNVSSKNKNLESSPQKSNLPPSSDICHSLEDLVKTFDQNVKTCLSNYKDIDVGQLAPVQVRSQEQLMNESQ